MTQDDALAQRYGAPRPWRRVAVAGVTALVAVAFLAWLGWSALFHAAPEVESELVGFDVVDEHTVKARVRVTLRDPDVEPRCRVRAFADDHTPVGDLSWDPTEAGYGGSGVQEVTVRTARRATTVERVGCTTPGQPRPR